MIFKNYFTFFPITLPKCCRISYLINKCACYLHILIYCFLFTLSLLSYFVVLYKTSIFEQIYILLAGRGLRKIDIRPRVANPLVKMFNKRLSRIVDKLSNVKLHYLIFILLRKSKAYNFTLIWKLWPISTSKIYQ